MTDPTETRVATCECGALTLTVTGAPVHHHGCTCTKCQRASGSVMTVTAWYPAGQVSIEGPEQRWFFNGEDDRRSMKVFCPTCGSGGYARSAAYLPDCIEIRVGTIADPAYPAPPHIHWWPNRPEWLKEPDGVDCQQGM